MHTPVPVPSSKLMVDPFGEGSTNLRGAAVRRIVFGDKLICPFVTRLRPTAFAPGRPQSKRRP
ncbi:hypothetical protein ACVH9Z_40165 [Rhodococcus opacus]|uniref:hypothetical protein n=1 Tax=Rhodococcus TaxID=1827 RepID=UPI0002F2398A|nr:MULTISPECIES: hypothetical protein [Rhodococcus]MDJ0416377.1 hypothetical protein [Rhodococcus opacus]MDV6243060.1 hypothetical protein [Rhodococcus opacus]MDX5964186.1 hypothetical protein [Rhodococcus opacus]QQZ17510.1 hypothetical protein GO592_16270 [Rhodococcus sp. 21391]CAG7611247.1 hypothetical protein E143388_06058 [Rhodococcus opacus]